MKQAAGLLAVGFAALLLQGVVAMLAPPRFCPDLAFLVIVAMGLLAPRAAGLALAAALGYATDLLSGSLLGQHALLSVVAFSATRLANRQLNLRGDLPRVIFVALLTVAYGLGLSGLSWVFDRPSALDGALLLALLVHAAVNALIVPFVYAGVARFSSALSDDDASRRPLRLETRRSLP